jgi:hypothetical protein
MSQFAAALGSKFAENKDAIRIRSFELGGHTFKVKVPLTAEFEAMQKRMTEVDDGEVEQFYRELIGELPEEDGDVIVEGRSLREAAKNKALIRNRITEMFKMLVPEDKNFDMGTIDYDMIEELFPFPVQMQVIEEISNVVSPSYVESRGK